MGRPSVPNSDPSTVILEITCPAGHRAYVSPTAVASGRAIFGSAADYCSYRLPDGKACEKRVVESRPLYPQPESERRVTVSATAFTWEQAEDLIKGIRQTANGDEEELHLAIWLWDRCEELRRGYRRL